MAASERILACALALSFSLVLAGCTGGDGSSRDRDEDGLLDTLETTPHAIVILTREGEVTREVTSDTGKADTDGDGLPDLDEYYRGVDPTQIDTDADGLLDGHNVTPGDEATLTAWRAMGLYESPRGTFVGEMGLCASYGGAKANAYSSDRPVPDELGDAEELRGWDVVIRGEPRHVTSDPCDSDTDDDGLDDHLERDSAADPRDADTDRDGARDDSDADPAADLALRLSGITIDPPREGVILTLTVGARTAASQGGTVELNVDDTSASRDSLVANAILEARDADGAPVKLFGARGGVIIAFDVVKGTSDAGPTQRLAFEGEDGSITLDWATLRG